MIYHVTVEPEVARAIEAKATDKNLTPEAFLVEEIERIVQQVEAANAEELRVKQARERRERTAPL